ncbi:MAG: nucleotidyl transferase AbiEii/AbiGii toxin family protein [Thermodesulfobacteriota bacterium]|nr:MAG: nucleotidyl transferase AbiEii/AbiGii toxin family protein [Thermodesulfobacteriota bacterium]
MGGVVLTRDNKKSQIEFIKRTAIIALFSDDHLMNIFVLKGGNAIDLILNINERSSMDLDFSIENDFSEEELDQIKLRIERTLENTFKTHGFVVFDLSFQKRPEIIPDSIKEFWGGYQIEFKVIDMVKKGFAKNLNDLRRRAEIIGNKQQKKIKVDISKYEYCIPKIEKEIDGYTIYIYSPEMIVCEKLRAICQQMPEYIEKTGNRKPSARARDFFDIYHVSKNFGIDLAEEENSRLLKLIFEAKRVPLHLIGQIEKEKEFHSHDFIAVKDTVRSNKIEDFAFYFEYVVNMTKGLKPLWEI